jgi:iron only hydrogenase large subunit-like protein
MMGEYFHSVTLDEEKCRGCTNCIKRCPTEAIRVRKGKARIINERCIDCGECIRICPYHAKKAITDDFSRIKSYAYRIAIPAPSLYGQFKPVYTRNRILNAIRLLGFDDVYEVARGAEFVTEATKKLLKRKDVKKPLISSACPAVVRLIQVRFPNLIDHLVRLESPMEVSAKLIRRKASLEKGIDAADIGVFFITPCAAKATSVKAPYENLKSSVDGVISIKDIYLRLLSRLEQAGEQEQLARAGLIGIRWANSGGEGLALETDRFLAVDGIHNVITILEAIENDKLEDVDFIEALSCSGGCLGGPLTVENVYVAKTRLKKHVDEAKTAGHPVPEAEEAGHDIVWTGSIVYKPVMKLDDDLGKAMKKLEELEQIYSGLPGLDCGACGAPNCRALAEDIVRGVANETDCIFKLREKVRDLAAQMIELESKIPPVMDNGAKDRHAGTENYGGGRA